MTIQYNIEKILPGFISGWAWDNENNSTHVTIKLYNLDGELIFVSKANQYREDLHREGIGNGDKAFDINTNCCCIGHMVLSCTGAQPVKIILNENETINICYDEEYATIVLNKLEKALPNICEHELPSILSTLPLDIFGQICLSVPEKFPRVKDFLPTMPSSYIQSAWTGLSGSALLQSSCAFIRSLLMLHSKHVGKDLYAANVLDYGCGWGRLSRLLLKYVPVTQLFAADAWQESLDIFTACNIHKQVVLTNEYPKEPPFPGIKMNVIFAFSVLTHTSEICSNYIMSCLRKQIDDNVYASLP